MFKAKNVRFSIIRNHLRRELKNLESILKSSKLENSSVDTKTIFLEGLNRIMMEVHFHNVGTTEILHKLEQLLTDDVTCIFSYLMITVRWFVRLERGSCRLSSVLAATNAKSTKTSSNSSFIKSSFIIQRVRRPRKRVSSSSR